MEKKDRRNHILLLLLAGILLTAAGCGSSEKGPTAPEEEKESTDIEELRLKFSELPNLFEAGKSSENVSEESAGLPNLLKAGTGSENASEESAGLLNLFEAVREGEIIPEEDTEAVVSEEKSEETEILPEDNYPNTWVNTGNQAEDLAAVAMTQVGNQETDEQYTKYAYWYYGRALPASWNAIFVSWCANQAGIPESIIRKNASSGCNKRIIDKNPFECQAYLFGTVTPEVGDIAFIDDNSDSFSEKVGIITTVDYDWITVVMGDYENMVSAVKYISWSGEKADESGSGTGEVIMFFVRPAYE